jgi:hypothetical protein
MRGVAIMEQSQKPEEAPTVMPKPQEETTRVRLAIEELEKRLAPQSTTSILD